MSEVAAAYDEWSSTYETCANATRDLAASVLRRQLPERLDRDVLEIGCGTGLNTRYLAARSRSVLAFDFSAGMLEQARASVVAANVRFEQQDIRSAWQTATDSVDLIVCTLVLEHIEDLHPVFSEAARVLRHGGEIFVSELHPYRQLLGGQAQFPDEATGEVNYVAAYLHDVSDYVRAWLRQGFELISLDEWRDAEDAAQLKPPRLLSFRLRRAGRR